MILRASYCLMTRKLEFQNQEIQMGHYLLKNNLQRQNKMWEYDEIAEDWADDYKKDDCPGITMPDIKLMKK